MHFLFLVLYNNCELYFKNNLLNCLKICCFKLIKTLRAILRYQVFYFGVLHKLYSIYSLY